MGLCPYSDMAILAIPMTSDRGSSYDIVLREAKFNFLFLWNDVDSAWFLDVSKDDVLLIGSIRLVYGLNLLFPFQHLLPGRMALSVTRELGQDRLAIDTPNDKVEQNLFLGYDDFL